MGWSLASIASHKQSAGQLTVAGLQGACARMLGTSQYVRVTTYPKTCRKR